MFQPARWSGKFRRAPDRIKHCLVHMRLNRIISLNIVNRRFCSLRTLRLVSVWKQYLWNSFEWTSPSRRPGSRNMITGFRARQTLVVNCLLTLLKAVSNLASRSLSEYRRDKNNVSSTHYTKFINNCWKNYNKISKSLHANSTLRRKILISGSPVCSAYR